MSKYPQVRLDRTLHDLYKEDGGNADEVAQLIALPAPFGSVAKSMPACTKYVYHTPTAPDMEPFKYARMCLGNGPQNHGFIAGPQHLYLFDLDPPAWDVEHGTVESPPAHRADAERVFDVLVPEQRPKLHFIADAAAFEPVPGVKINPYPPLDFLDRHPTTMPQDDHYRLLSKRDLALSGLPTPPTQIVDGALGPDDVGDAAKVAAEAERMIAATGVRDRALPFVLKFPQSLSGSGVFVVADEPARAHCLGLVEKTVPEMLGSLTPANAPLQPVSLLVQDMIAGDKVSAVCLFVTRTGRVIFIHGVEQYNDANGHYAGAVIDYERQAEYEARFRDISERMGAYVHSRGFYGMLGADIMTDAVTGAHILVDLNTRIPGDCMVGPLRSFFLAERGLRYVHCIPRIGLLGDRDHFEARFDAELRAGRIVVIGWSRGKGGPGGAIPFSIASFVLGGTTEAELLELVGRVNALAPKRPGT